LVKKDEQKKLPRQVTKGKAAPKAAEPGPDQQKPAKKLKSRQQWEREQRERMHKDAKYIARQQQAARRLSELSERIEICDAEYARLKSDGNAIEALQWLERGVWLRRDRDGVGTEEVERSAQTLVGDCNILGMAALQVKLHVCAVRHGRARHMRASFTHAC
jgi:type IV secretory pathway VirB10-like protein